MEVAAGPGALLGRAVPPTPDGSCVSCPSGSRRPAQDVTGCAGTAGQGWRSQGWHWSAGFPQPLALGHASIACCCRSSTGPVSLQCPLPS